MTITDSRTSVLQRTRPQTLLTFTFPVYSFVNIKTLSSLRSIRNTNISVASIMFNQNTGVYRCDSLVTIKKKITKFLNTGFTPPTMLYA